MKIKLMLEISYIYQDVAKAIVVWNLFIREKEYICQEWEKDEIDI